MANPTKAAWKLVKRIGRYLKEAPRLVQRFKFQELGGEVVLTGDSDYAGCRNVCKSTSGGALRIGGHAIKTWASTQAVISRSSGEAEYYAMFECPSVGLGVASLAEDFGLQLDVVVETDSTAAKGISGRRGLGQRGTWQCASCGCRSGRGLGKLGSGRSGPREVLQT